MIASDGIGFRWLGVAGLELVAQGHTLLIDPYLTRIPFHRQWLGKVCANRDQIAAVIHRCDLILVTHAHYDHLLDVPEIMRQTGAMAAGSANVCRLLTCLGVESARVREIHVGDRLESAGFVVEVRSATHMLAPGFAPGKLPRVLRQPLRARDYRMDESFSFLVRTLGCRLLTDPGERPEDAVATDVLLLYPRQRRDYYERLLPVAQPRLVIPSHWDAMWRPLSQPMRPMPQPPSWGFPPFRRVDLGGWADTVRSVAPGSRDFVPEALQRYDLVEQLGVASPKLD